MQERSPSLAAAALMRCMRRCTPTPCAKRSMVRRSKSRSCSSSARSARLSAAWCVSVCACDGEWCTYAFARTLATRDAAFAHAWKTCILRMVSRCVSILHAATAASSVSFLQSPRSCSNAASSCNDNRTFIICQHAAGRHPKQFISATFSGTLHGQHGWQLRTVAHTAATHKGETIRSSM